VSEKSFSLTVYQEGTEAFTVDITESDLRKTLDEMRHGKSPDSYPTLLAFIGADQERYYISSADIGFFKLVENAGPA
jgi:hypothetical protein